MRATQRMCPAEGRCQRCRTAAPATFLWTFAAQLLPCGRDRHPPFLSAPARVAGRINSGPHSAYSEGAGGDEPATASCRLGYHRWDRHADHSRHRVRGKGPDVLAIFRPGGGALAACRNHDRVHGRAVIGWWVAKPQTTDIVLQALILPVWWTPTTNSNYAQASNQRAALHRLGHGLTSAFSHFQNGFR